MIKQICLIWSLSSGINLNDASLPDYQSRNLTDPVPHQSNSTPVEVVSEGDQSHIPPNIVRDHLNTEPAGNSVRPNTVSPRPQTPVLRRSTRIRKHRVPYDV